MESGFFMRKGFHTSPLFAFSSLPTNGILLRVR